MTFSNPQPPAMSSPTSANQAIDQFHERYLSLTGNDGPYKPMVLTSPAVGILLLLCVFLVDTRRLPAPKVFRAAAWVFFATGFVYNLRYVRARNPAVAYGVGLVSVWLMVWTASLLVFTDVQSDARRIKRRCIGDTSPAQCDHDAKQRDTSSSGTLFWQSYPDRLSWERFDWVADLFFNFRGTGWSWRIDNLPPLPKPILKELGVDESSRLATPAKYRRIGEAASMRNSSHLLRHTLLMSIRDYLIIDFLKTLSVYDPYFWGILDGPPPSYLPTFMQQSTVIVKSSHLLLTLGAMGIALQYVFSVAPLFFVGLLGPRIGVRGEPWMYPDSFGSFRAVFDTGLLGWWNFWWHSMFRQGFVAPGRQINSWLKLNRRSTAGRVVQLVVAFVLSGCIHAGGSLTQLGESSPLRGPFTFFVLQIVGIAVQMAAMAVFARTSLVKFTPRPLRQLANFMYVHVWFYHTAHLLVDDLAVGGLWLFEPLPISLFRGLGFGPANGGGLFCWASRPFWWHQGQHWWDTGIAM